MNTPGVNEAFTLWAKSFSGCNGGNPNCSIWFCGIEYSISKEAGDKKYTKIDEPDPVSGIDRRKKFIKYPYIRNVLKLYSAILGEKVSNYKKVFHTTGAFDKKSDVFKLNLYPVPFKNTKSSLWTTEHSRNTGLASKSQYREWCRLNRFPVIKKWMEEYKPKAIICTGITHPTEFNDAFFSPDHEIDRFKHEIIDEKKLYHLRQPETNTIIFIIPFLGWGGLIRNMDITNFGIKINSITEEYHGPHWKKALSEFRLVYDP